MGSRHGHPGVLLLENGPFEPERRRWPWSRAVAYVELPRVFDPPVAAVDERLLRRAEQDPEAPLFVVGEVLAPDLDDTVDVWLCQDALWGCWSGTDPVRIAEAVADHVREQALRAEEDALISIAEHLHAERQRQSKLAWARALLDDEDLSARPPLQLLDDRDRA